MLVSACTISTDPISYHDSIAQLITQADQKYEAYNNFTQSHDISEIVIISKELTTTIEEINNIHDKLIAIGPYDQDNSYLNAATSYLTHMLALLRNEETQLINLRTEVANYPDAERTPEIELTYRERQKTLIDTINTQIQSDNQALMEAQESFAQEYNLTFS
jgi:hypothetical protein